jgi:DNA-binding NarL/FixJ family response regulator
LKVLLAASEEWDDARSSAIAAAHPNIQVTQVNSAEALGKNGLNGDDWDVVLMDFDLPGASGHKGVQATSLALRPRPLGILLQAGSHELAHRVMASGASGILPADISPNMLGHAVHLLAGGMRLSMLDGHKDETAQAITSQLSDRELQVLAGICDGMQNKEIAHKFDVQEVTVKMHVRAIIHKLGARNRTHAAMLARDLHLV